ncbi:MAG: glyoxalase [Alphaproteobacteria bacterium]|nr:glyoxalase [Alphaproteobacteria bacterium]
MTVSRLAHVSLRTPNLETAREFYCGVLGLRAGYRPPFPFPGLWLYDESGVAVVHLIACSDGADGYLGRRESGVGDVLDHVAFAAQDWPSLKLRLETRGLSYQVRVVPELEQQQVFVRDPCGAVVELLFPADASAALPNRTRAAAL